MLKLIIISSLIFCAQSFQVTAQNVNIPDPIFKNYLIDNLAINTNGDAEIQVSEATLFSGVIYCPSLGIYDLGGIEAFTNATELICNGNNLSLLIFPQTTSFTTIDCSDNQITDIVISNSPNLNALNCGFNNLYNLNISGAPMINTLFCMNNNLTNLDLSNHEFLGMLDCSNNSLVSLNIQNGYNYSISYFNAMNNSLSCIQVDNPGMFNFNMIDPGVIFSDNCPTICNVNIPDANFKSYLLGNAAINTNMDGEIQCDEAEAFTGTINCSGLNINSLQGIEAFINLTGLQAVSNNINLLDLSSNTALTTLFCSFNPLQDLDLSFNTALNNLACISTPLTQLDLSSNPALTTVRCYNSQIASLVLSNNPNLTLLECYNNQLTSLDLSACTSLNNVECYNNLLSNLNLGSISTLVGLGCNNNQLSNLDLTNNVSLIGLDCSNNQLSALDLSNNTSLLSINCSFNQIQVLDLSANYYLNILGCNNNELTILNLKNSNNTALNSFNALNNNLTCIEVSNVAWCTSNLTNIDAIASFSDDCNYVYPPDAPSLLAAVVSFSPLAVSLSWTDNATDELGYKVYRSTNSAAFIEIADLPANTENYSDNSVLINNVYSYRVLAHNDAGNSNFSNTIQVNTNAASILSSNAEIVKMYPNPAESVLAIEMNEPTTVTFLDVLGKTISSEHLNSGKNTIEVSHLLSGVYFIRTSNGTTFQFIKK